MSKGKNDIVDPDELIREEEEFHAKQKERRNKAIEQLLEQRRELDEKLSKLGYQSATQSAGKGRKPQADGERKQRTCPKCGQLGHRWTKCPNPAQASWSKDPRNNVLDL